MEAPVDPKPIEQAPYTASITPEQLKEITGAVLFTVGAIMLAAGIAINFGAGWGCTAGGFFMCVAAGALLQGNLKDAV